MTQYRHARGRPVLVRSVSEHRVSYRSPVIHGEARKVTDPEEKPEGLRRLTERAAPGQWPYDRLPDRKDSGAGPPAAAAGHPRTRTHPAPRGDPARLTWVPGHTVRSRTPEPEGESGWAAVPHWSRI
ncbi:pyridoxamine 5'-phosphate oxidase family protein [Streptomyces sp. NPDC049541]|uniref:pyridoxamine 5'-phosphate oxidase family protein n=1 Tax=Streptomyces sp. NPDC049541 TaxID=3365594 RepID=UPI0037AF5F79